jgi:hypothetical protein
MKNRLCLLAAAIACVGVLSACNPSTANSSLTGNWAGSATTTLNSVTNQPATMTTALSQDGTIVTGTATVVSSEATYTSTIAGTFDGSNLYMQLSPLDLTQCSYIVHMSYANNVLSGRGSVINCTVPATVEMVLKPN